MTLTIPNPSMIKVSFGTYAEFIAASIPDQIILVMAAGLLYEYDAAGTAATTAGGRKWNPLGWGTPEHFNALADGADDATALQAWIDYQVAKYSFSGISGNKLQLLLGGRNYSIGSTLSIPSTIKAVVFGYGTLTAIGTGWTAATDFMVHNDAARSNFPDLTLECSHLCSGMLEEGGRTRYWSPRFYHFTEYGLYKSVDTGGDLRMWGGEMFQYQTSDAGFADQANFTATCISVHQSDCKIHDTNLLWAGTCYEGNGGQHELHGVHLVQGTAAAYERTNAKLVQWSSSGKIFFHGCYFDNGYSDFDDDQVHFRGCKVLVDNDDVDLSSMFRFYYNGQAEPRATSDPFEFVTWDEMTTTVTEPDLFKWLPDRTTPFDDWPTDYTPLETHLNGVLDSQFHRNNVGLNNKTHLLSTNVDDPAVVYVTAGSVSTISFKDKDTTSGKATFGSKGDNAYINATEVLETGVKAVQLVVLSAEPTAAGNGSFALSDGTASTNNFGVYGAGVYNKTAGTWRKDRPGEFTVATLPAISGTTGHIIYVSDETGGATIAFSDGTNWLRVQDRAVVS